MTARQLWHCTLRVAVCHPRSSSGSSRSAVTRSRSTTFPVSRSITYGDSVPQNGHTNFCLPGFHSACAPQAGHECFSSAASSRFAGFSEFARFAELSGVSALTRVRVPGFYSAM